MNAATGALIAAPFGAIGYGALVGRTNFRVREIDIAHPRPARAISKACGSCCSAIST